MVKIEFNNSTLNNSKTLQRGGSNTHSNSDSKFNNYLESSQKENFLLSHHDLKEFVDNKRKTDKLEHFAKLSGFEKVVETRKILMQA